MFKEFRSFILRGNVVDLAVGIAVGAAFTSVVNSLVKGFIDPLISLLYGGTKIASLTYSVRGKEFLYGEVINSIITFLVVAAVVFFLVVQPINKLTEKFNLEKNTEEASTKKCQYCLSVIPQKATRCKFCTSKLDTKEA